jgi:hypothetical protein
MGAREIISWTEALSFYEGRYGWYFESPQRMVFGPYRTEAIARRKATAFAEALTGWPDGTGPEITGPARLSLRS